MDNFIGPDGEFLLSALPIPGPVSASCQRPRVPSPTTPAATAAPRGNLAVELVAAPLHRHLCNLRVRVRPEHLHEADRRRWHGGHEVWNLFNELFTVNLVLLGQFNVVQ